MVGHRAARLGRRRRPDVRAARRRSAGLAGQGRPLAVGEPANLVLVDPDAPRTVVDRAELASRSRNTPYAGRTLPARVVATFLRGRATVLDGELVEAGA